VEYRTQYTAYSHARGEDRTGVRWTGWRLRYTNDYTGATRDVRVLVVNPYNFNYLCERNARATRVRCRGVSRWSFAAGARRRVKELARAAAAVTLFFFSQKKSSQKGQAFKNSSQYFSHAICKVQYRQGILVRIP
jgi:hypothetical protein